MPYNNNFSSSKYRGGRRSHRNANNTNLNRGRRNTHNPSAYQHEPATLENTNLLSKSQSKDSFTFSNKKRIRPDSINGDDDISSNNDEDSVTFHNNNNNITNTNKKRNTNTYYMGNSKITSRYETSKTDYPKRHYQTKPVSRYEGSNRTSLTEYSKNASTKSSTSKNTININSLGTYKSRFDNTTPSNTISNRDISRDKDTGKQNKNTIFNLPKGPRSSRQILSQRSNSSASPVTSSTARTIPNKSRYSGSSKVSGTVRETTCSYPKYQTISSQERSTSVYERILQVGEGTYGKVYKAKNTLTRHLVALKKLRLQNEREGFPITSIREIKLLQSFNHPNVSSIREIMIEGSRTIYMIFDYADNDLSGILLSKNIKLKDSQRKHIFKQLLEGCFYLHDKCQVIHRDIKGSNILIDNMGNVKITDFGLARKINLDSKTELSQGYTNRVITLWYRPPELLLGTTQYTTEVDMWGCGCLLLELFTTYAIFQGSNEIETITNIFKLMGTPNLTNFPNLFEMPWFFMVISNIKEKYEYQFDNKFKDIIPSLECLKLVKGLLDYDQKKRFSAKEALESPYFTENPLPEPLILNGDEREGGCHEYEVKLAKKQQKEKEKEKLLKN
ncbi:cyclin-dependent serine/threonine protein kinase CTK1 PWA37_001271 [Arxiozyma heterogenica]|uniref:cyclin-dependent serine/threonine protein kinase CTK1 n=1 Tax=Arxiozyma heterogenica TaxID=278026 RepID=UPI002F06087F